MTLPIRTLPEIESQIWELLVQGSQNPKEAFYTAALGTISAYEPSIRTVVIRDVIATDKKIICYSDNRASKVKEIQKNLQVSWLFWDAEKKIQLRLRGQALIHTNDTLTQAYWQKANLIHRRNYLTLQAPGTLQNHPTSGLPEGLDIKEPSLEESEQGRQNFAVIVCSIQFIDWLHLDNKGHRRAIFRYGNSNLSEASWVTP